MNRIDIHTQVFQVENQKLRDIRPAQIRKYCVLYEACQNLVKTAMGQLQPTARGYHRVLKLTCTIAVSKTLQEGK